MTKQRDRVIELRVAGLRAIDQLTLPLDGLTVLMGENGAGKSTLVEALELLRKAATAHAFVSDVLVQQHGGLRGALLRHGARHVRLGVSIEGAGPRVDYDLWLGLAGSSERVLGERAVVHPGHESEGDVDPGRALDEPRCLLWGHNGTTFVLEPPVSLTAWGGSSSEPMPFPGELAGRQVGAGHGQVALGLLGQGAPRALERLVRCLERLEAHPPFSTRPLWQQHELSQQLGPRWPAVLDHVERMPRYGVGLSNALLTLRNAGGEVWSRVLTRAQLGLGSDLRDIVLPAVGRGRSEVALRFAHAPERDYPAEGLSEGQLAYLCFVALVGLAASGAGATSLLAIDEPELHLHPALLARVVLMLEELSSTTPVLVATHSSRLLDLLPDPARSVVLCELVSRTVRLRRPDPARLEAWLRDYDGLGSLRDQGLEQQVFEGSEPSDLTDLVEVSAPGALEVGP